MERRTLGKVGPVSSQIALGCMGMSDLYGPAERGESLSTIHAALDAGINLFDTGDFYGMGHNEMLLAEALASRPRYELLLSVKFGALRDPGGSWLGMDCRPAALKNFLAHSLMRLKTEYIDIYRPARLDPQVPIEETIGALGEMVRAGYIRWIGLSEIGAETLRRACAVHEICDLQIEYSLLSRGIEDEILPACRELGVGITAYGVLSRGLLSGGWDPSRGGQRDFRSNLPRFSGDNLQSNLALLEHLRKLAEPHGATVSQVAIAWVLSRGEEIIPLIGARRQPQLDEALRGAELKLSAEELAELDNLFPHGVASGDRYHSAQMAHLDSERRGGT